MSEQLIANITEQLHQEKWTRTAITNYTVTMFQELDEALEKVFEARCQDEVLHLCEEHLRQSKNSIVALYISGIIHLTRQSINDSNLLILINQFIDSNKWKIAEWLAERILDFGENKHAYRTLANCYVNEGNEEKKFEVWEKLVRVDYEEADIVRLLAEHAEAGKNVESAVSYYKKALHRYINRHMFSPVRDMWKKLIQFIPDETEFFLHAEGKVAKVLSEDRSVMLLEDLFPYYRDAGKWDIALDILKKILAYDPKSAQARNDLVACYRQKHQDHSQLEEYIRLSNLGSSWRPVQDAIADFEKHIAFDSGNYVFHRTWGVGRIKSIKDDFITIDFIKQKGHRMSLKLAVGALTILGKDHIWVYRTTMEKAKLREKILKDPAWALKVIIKSFDNQADMKRVKLELADSGILGANEWTTWSTKARNELKTNESFGNLPDKPDVFVVRDQPITVEEKTFNRFKAEKDFFNRIKILQEFLSYVETQDAQTSVESDLFREMFEYFVNYVRNMNQVNEFTLGSMLVVRYVVERFNFLNPGVNLDFREAIEALGEDTEAIFIKLSNPELRRSFMHVVRKNSRNWPELYLQLFPLHLSKELIQELVKAGKQAEVQAMFNQAFGMYRDNREMVVWFIKNCRTDDWFVEMNLSQERLLIALIHLYDISNREIDNKKDLAENRRLNKQTSTILFKEGLLMDFLKVATEDSLRRVHSLLNDARGIDHEFEKQAKQLVKQRFPQFVFPGEQNKEREIESSSRIGFYTLYQSFELKSKALANLQGEEVSKNSKEIAVAREFGDLKENAEYKAAKERQEILNSTAAKWKQELEQAKVVNADDVDASRVNFGCRVELLNQLSNKKETYTIMGPWESNPEEGIISYLSPFGQEIYRKQAGDSLKFTINEREYQYTVNKITKVDFAVIKTTTGLIV